LPAPAVTALPAPAARCSGSAYGPLPAAKAGGICVPPLMGQSQYITLYITFHPVIVPFRKIYEGEKNWHKYCFLKEYHLKLYLQNAEKESELRWIRFITMEKYI